MKKSEVLQEEIEWFETALNNSKNLGYHSEYRKGFEAAIGWLKLHRDIALGAESDGDDDDYDVDHIVKGGRVWVQDRETKEMYGSYSLGDYKEGNDANLRDS